jgi:O-antigen/teichoic acid export membrane protein
MSSLRKLASQTAIYGISSILGRFVNWALTPLYTNYFKPGEYGASADLYAWMTYFLVILTFGMETAYFRLQNDKEGPKAAYKDAFLFVAMLSGSFFVLSLLFLNPIANWLDYADQPKLIALVAAIIFMDVAAWMPMAKLRQEEQAKKFVMITMVNIGVNVVLNLIFIIGMGKGIEYIFISNLIASGVKLAMCLPESLPETWKPDFKAMKLLASFGFYIMIAGLLGMLVQNVEKNMIPHWWADNGDWHGHARTGKEMLGLYSAGFRLAMVIQLATQAFRYAADPFFFRVAQQGDSRPVLARAFHYYWIVILACFLFVCVFRSEIAHIRIMGHYLIGPDYWEGLDVVPLSLLAYCLFGAYQQISIWFKMTKQTRFGILFSAAGAVVVLVVNVITIPVWGYMGSAIASLAAFGVMTAWAYYLGQKYYAVPYKMERALINSGIFLGTAFLCEQVEAFWPRAFLCLAALFACYVIDRVNPLKFKTATA